MQLMITGKIVDHKLYVTDLNSYHYIMEAMNNESVTIKFVNQRMSKTEAQLAFYYGIIIRKYCMESNDFGGWSDMEISNHFESMFLSRSMLIKSPRSTITKKKSYIKSISSLSKSQMNEFISNVLFYLSTEFGLEISNPYERGKD